MFAMHKIGSGILRLVGLVQINFSEKAGYLNLLRVKPTLHQKGPDKIGNLIEN